MQFPGIAVDHAFYTFYIGFPHSAALSIGMAYVITEMNALATNITLSHLDTSSTSAFITFHIVSHHVLQTRNIDILTEIGKKSK